MTNTTNENVDHQELQKFSEQAAHWWDPKGPLKTLHDINPLRIQFIESCCSVLNQSIIDVGCGGGILSEGLASKDAQVTGIDRSEALIQTAKLHLLESKLNVDYQCSDIEAFSQEHPESFDILTCMELLEHVPDPGAIVKACARLVKPGGMLFFSTINRNTKAFAFAIVGAEYLLRLLPKGTHDYAKFIKPSELARFAREYDLNVKSQAGLHYNPLSGHYWLDEDVSVNYFMALQKC